jgi:hypothetical protein
MRSGDIEAIVWIKEKVAQKECTLTGADSEKGGPTSFADPAMLDKIGKLFSCNIVLSLV